MKKYLVTVFITILLLLVQSVIYAQSDNYRNDNNPNSNTRIELSVIKKSETTLTDKEHVYILQAVNKSDNDIEIQIIAGNVSCNEKINISFDHKIYQDNIHNGISNGSQNIKIKANSSTEFYVKLINPSNDKLDSWNCTEVKAMGTKNNILSNNILIESFVPNPKNFR